MWIESYVSNPRIFAVYDIFFGVRSKLQGGIGQFFVFFYTGLGHKYKWVVFGTRNSSKQIFQVVDKFLCAKEDIFKYVQK